METPENLQDRLFHLAWLGEELPAATAHAGTGWIYRQIAREAAAVLRVAVEYMAEHETARVYLDARGTITTTHPADTDQAGADTGYATWAEVAAVIAARAVDGRTLPAPSHSGGGAL